MAFPAHGKIDALGALLAGGANPHLIVEDTRETAIHVAAKAGIPAALDMIFEPMYEEKSGEVNLDSQYKYMKPLMMM